MAKYDLAWAAATNGNVYRDFLRREPLRKTFTLTRAQLEAICRDLIDYTDRDAEASAWAEEATKNAAEIARLRGALERVKKIHAETRGAGTMTWFNASAEQWTVADAALGGSVEQTALVAKGMEIVHRIMSETEGK